MNGNTRTENRLIRDLRSIFVPSSFNRYKGYIQTFSRPPQSEIINYDTLNKGKEDKVRLWAHLNVPQGHVVMISLVDVSFGNQPLSKDCQERVELSQSPQRTAVWTLCSRHLQLPDTTVLDTDSLHMDFESGAQDMHAFILHQHSLQLVFSFYQNTTIPNQLSNKTWDCSDPSWSDWKSHFRCDLVPDCAGGEDEMDCGYTLCGRHSVLLGNKCFSLHTSTTAITWHQANARCIQSGGRLANTRKKADTQAIISQLKLASFIRTDQLVITGLRTPDTDIFL